MKNPRDFPLIPGGSYSRASIILKPWDLIDTKCLCDGVKSEI